MVRQLIFEKAIITTVNPNMIWEIRSLKVVANKSEGKSTAHFSTEEINML